MSTTVSVKLSKSSREDILRALLKDKYKDELEALYLRAAKLAIACYEKVYTPEQRQMLKDLPEGWVPMHDKISVRIAGSTKEFGLHFNGLSRMLPWKPNNDGKIPDIKFPTPQCYVHSAFELNKTDPLAKELFAIQLAGEALEEKKKKLSRDIEGVLLSVSTSGKLIEAWPEIADVVKKHVAVPTPVQTLPVRVMTNLNKELGLGKAA